MSDIYIGIDPGVEGGIAAIAGDEVRLWAMPKGGGVTLIAQEIFTEMCFNESHAYMENVSARGGWSSQTYKALFRTFGWTEEVFTYNCSTFNFVQPVAWKSYFNLTSDKGLSIALSKKLYPQINLLRTPRCRNEHDGMAEALLIADYGRRIKKGITYGNE